MTARDVDVVVTVSSTGIATPSLEARVATRMGFRADVMRVPVFGLGCAGGVSGLALGARLARAEPGEVVLVVVVELCTLAFRADRISKADVISSALFGDGAAAAVLRAGPRRAGLQHRRRGRAYLARHARHHGLVGRSDRLRRRAVALAAALRRAAAGRAGAPLPQAAQD